MAWIPWLRFLTAAARRLRARPDEAPPDDHFGGDVWPGSQLHALDATRILRAAQELGFASPDIYRLEKIALALVAGRPLPITTLARNPRAALQAARAHGPRRIASGSGRTPEEAFLVSAGDMQLIIETLLRATPTRYGTGAELYHHFVRHGPPFPSTPNPQPLRPSTEEPPATAPQKKDEP